MPQTVAGYESFYLSSSWENKMGYHLAYHRSMSLHLNHLFFLHTYVFGLAIVFGALGVWPLAVFGLILIVVYYRGGGVLTALYICCIVFLDRYISSSPLHGNIMALY